MKQKSGRKRKGGRKLRPLHLPSPISVRTDGRGRPTAVGSGKAVVQIREVWRIDDEWWREPVSRLYFETVLEDGRRMILYRDLVKGGWYAQGG